MTQLLRRCANFNMVLLMSEYTKKNYSIMFDIYIYFKFDEISKRMVGTEETTEGCSGHHE